MHLLHCVLMLNFVISDDTLGFIVRGPSGPLVVPLGGSVILPCYVETSSVAEKVKVVWKKTDSETLVHLYEDGKSRPESQHKDYHDRAHFFTDQIQHGNLSLLLENMRAEDKGVYICKVYSQQVAEKTLVEIKDVVYLLVSGLSRSILVSVGEDATLNCFVDSHIAPDHIEEVLWKKTDEDIHVLLYQNNETSSDSSDERYRDRVEFFTAEIPKGNFSLRLKSVRTEDKGVYMCQVFAGGLSANATAVLVQLGFSWLHIIVLILCIIAFGFALGFALRLCWLVYSKSENRDTRFCLQVGLVLCPLMTMLLASVIWHFIEGSLYETISCCMLYILGPLRLFWVTPLATGFPAKILKYVMTAHADHAAFMVLMYSVILVEHFENISTAIRAVAIGLLVLICLLFIIQLAEEKLLSCFEKLCRGMYSKVQSFVATCSFSWLLSLQLALVLYSHFAFKEAFIIIASPVLHWLTYFFCRKKQCCLRFLYCMIWLMMIAMSGVMVYFYIMLMRKEKDDAGLICVAGFIQALWVLAFSEVPVHYKKLRMKTVLFLYGSAGLVLVNSVALMTELIMKAVHGERLVGDLRIIVFPSECLFTVALLILSIVTSFSGKPVNTDSQVASQMSTHYNGTPGSKHTSIDMKQMTGESNEMETLSKVAGNSEEHQEQEIN